jgi:hydroxypyruvate reductase
MGEGASLRAIVEAGVARAIEAVQPCRCIPRHVKRNGERLIVNGTAIELPSTRRILVLGAGKASAGMARAMEAILGDRIDEGLVITADGYGTGTQRIEIVEAGHPMADARGVAATRRLACLAASAGAEDLIIVLLSGGGSALLCIPRFPVTLAELVETNTLLLRSGLPIHVLNVVRKHLSEVKGGQLAALAHPATIVSLILSDVPGDRLDAIASGPTVPDPTSHAEAIRILQSHGLWARLPSTVQGLLRSGQRETIKPQDQRMRDVTNVLVGTGRDAAAAAAGLGKERGFRSVLASSTLRGEARDVGRALGAIARRLRAGTGIVGPPAWLTFAGETTVTVRGKGRGGRNQEVALAAAAEIAGMDGVVIASVGTDGRDGPTDAAGAVVDGGTVARLRRAGGDPAAALRDNDSYEALRASGALLTTGPTGTNVADLVVVAVHAATPRRADHRS